MASKDSNPLPTKSQTTSPTTKENVANTTVTPPKTAAFTDQGLADLPTSPTKEAGRKQEVLQKAQLESKSAVKEVKEKTPPSPTTCMHCYALEVWIKVETSPGNFTPPEEESYSACEVRGPKPQLLVFINFTLISHSELKINLDVHPSWVLSLLSSLIDIVVSTSLFR